MPKHCRDLTGMRFGRLVVQSFAEYRYQPCGKRNAYWHCVCDCGNTTITASRQLLRGSTKSCGCLAHDVHYRGGMTKLYSVLRMMKKRCNDPSYKQFKDYGARGISVCKEWDNGYEGYQAFKKWAASNGYKDGLTIERIDNNKGYSPDNCTWKTMKEQCNNKRNNLHITIGDKTQSLMMWCEEYNMPYERVYTRYRTLGWNILDALTLPLISPGGKHG